MKKNQIQGMLTTIQFRIFIYVYIGFDVLTAVVIKSTIFWDIMDYTALYPRR
jgi:hypothetical protein